MSRPKSKGNRDLPLNCSITNHGTFRYRHPVTKRDHGLGRDRAQAIEATKILNAELMPENTLVDKVLGITTKKFGEHLDYMESFWKSENKKGELADSTLKDYLRYNVKIRECFGDMPALKIQLGDVTAFLEQHPTGSAKHYRAALRIIFKHAVARGYAKENIASQTLPIKHKVLRKRLSLADYKTIYEYADPQTRNVMDLFLHTTQRPGDLVKFGFPVKEGGFYHFDVVQGKTKKHGKAAYIRMRVTPPLAEVVRRCRDEVVSEYLLHYPFKGKGSLRGKPYHRDTLSRMFKTARDKATKETGLYKKLDAKERPTLYEIRSLAIYLYDHLGFDAQKIAGHKDRAMTNGYLQGHPVEWTEVEAGLDMVLLDQMAARGEFDNYE